MKYKRVRINFRKIEEALKTAKLFLRGSEYEWVIDTLFEVITAIKNQGIISPYEKLLRHASDEDTKTIYKMLANKYHPDKGGDSRIMAEINKAYNEIIQRRKGG